ncbi:WG repeat-containing protein [Muricauda sp. CAU 1633]|uniref:WG repeat-containing protein n=1 Tax=Allomuricauda sp. CAU 1633 TaxID=2816036 RepID=UPI001A8C4769|nr:WG repeat-containing protein [Muricauda sp. CAU 1633]MBO0323703.1 WG repeat-containing protein [Muricauda sp. CAU 1633]
MKIVLSIFTVLFCIGINAQLPKDLDFVAPFHEGLAPVQKGNEWAFIDDVGHIVINFRDDLYWNKDTEETYDDVRSVHYPKFSNGRCIVQKMVDEIPVFGFIDTEGNLVIEHQFLNVRPFENGMTTGIIFEKVHRGKNEFNLDIYEYKFHEILMDVDGNILEFLNRRYNIQMTKKRYKIPPIWSKMLNNKLIAVKKDKNWEIKKLDL